MYLDLKCTMFFSEEYTFFDEKRMFSVEEYTVFTEECRRSKDEKALVLGGFYLRFLDVVFFS